MPECGGVLIPTHHILTFGHLPLASMSTHRVPPVLRTLTQRDMIVAERHLTDLNANPSSVEFDARLANVRLACAGSFGFR